MSLAGILLGILNIAIVVAILLLIGAVILWFASWMSIAVPTTVQRAFMILVFLIALYMLVALLLGVPSLHIITTTWLRLPGVGAA
jgi:hypothetical protein